MDKQQEREYLFVSSILHNKEHLLIGNTIVDSNVLIAANGIIYRAAQDILGRDEDVTPESVAYHLNESGMLDAVGGTDYINALYNVQPIQDGLTFRRLSDDIQRDGQVKQVRRFLSDLAESEEIVTLESIVGTVINELYKISTNDKEGNVKIADSIAKGSTERHAVTSTTIGELDECLNGGGYVPGDYVIIAARTSTGKTAIALQKSVAAVVNNVPTLIFSLEQTEPTLVGRLLKMTDADTLSSAPLYANFRRGLTIDQIYYYAQLAKLTDDIKVVVVDYMGLIRGQRSGENRNDFLGRVSQGLQTMARKLNVVVIAVCQLNREPDKEGREPELRDLRDSGNLEQDADIVILLHRPGKKDMTKIILAKQREGPLGSWVVTFDHDTGMFIE